MTLILEWQKAGIKVIELAQNAGRVESDTALYTAITSRSIAHYNDPTLNEHVINAVGVETPRGVRLAKEKSSLKIDGAVSLSMAHWGVLDRTNRGAPVHVTEYNLMAPGYHDAWNARPHPPGVTWENCRRRNRGCYACEAELKDEVIKDAEYWDGMAGGVTRDRETNGAYNAPEPQDGGKKYFWNEVKNIVDQNNQGE
jgi:hypothetical protein